MKLENISELSVKELSEKLQQAGITKARLDGAQSSTYLPESGRFIDFEVINPVNKAELSEENKQKLENGEAIEDNFTHVVVKTETGEQISLSRLQISGVKKEDFNRETANFSKSRNGKYFLKGDAINPHLSGNQAALIKKLMNRNFIAKECEVVVTEFSKMGYNKSDDVKTKIQKSYLIELED